MNSKKQSICFCKECQTEYSPRGLPTHIKYSHDLSIDEYVEKHGSSMSSNSYTNAGFEYMSTSRPGYWYFNSNDKRYHRSNFTKQNVLDMFENVDANKTEFENMVENGYDRIWDCGQLKYVRNTKGKNP